jgi:restriction system protein
MRNIFRVMLGRKSSFASEAIEGKYIGADFGIKNDLSDSLDVDLREFNEKYIPIFLKERPEKTRIGAGLACGSLYTICSGIKTGDLVLCPTGTGSYKIGEVTGGYFFCPNTSLPHRRPVKWHEKLIERSKMSQNLQNSSGSIGTVSNISKFSSEIESYLDGNFTKSDINSLKNFEEVSNFALEKHLEDFLVENWKQTELGEKYNIFQEDGELVGQQYLTDTGPIDILAVSKNNKELIVIELKKGRVSDSVLGQIQRYMGFVKDVIAKPEQIVKGIIIGLEDDKRIKRALSVTTNIEFYRYEISFKLFKDK